MGKNGVELQDPSAFGVQGNIFGTSQFLNSKLDRAMSRAGNDRRCFSFSSLVESVVRYPRNYIEGIKLRADFILPGFAPRCCANASAYMAGVRSLCMNGVEPEPDIAMTLWKRPLEVGDTRCKKQDIAPADSPIIVTLFGSPPKYAAFL